MRYHCILLCVCFVSLVLVDDHRLPSVPPILVTIPQDYPDDSPECSTSGQEYGSLIFCRFISHNSVQYSPFMTHHISRDT